MTSSSYNHGIKKWWWAFQFTEISFTKYIGEFKGILLSGTFYTIKKLNIYQTYLAYYVPWLDLTT